MLGLRLKEARLRAELSQEQLGIEAGLDPSSASARMNRYELGKRVPATQLVQELARVLNLPAAYFYSVDDDEALLLAQYHRLPKLKRQRLLEFANTLDSA